MCCVCLYVADRTQKLYIYSNDFVQIWHRDSPTILGKKFIEIQFVDD